VGESFDRELQLKNQIRLYKGLAAVIALAGATQAHSQTYDSAAFNVSVALTAKCTVKQPVGTVDFGGYTAFQSGAKPANQATLQYECTRGVVLSSVNLDTGADKTNTPTTGATPSTTGEGIVNGLRYSLNVAFGGRNAGTNASVGTGATNGSGDLVNYTINGSIEGNQAGAVGSGVTSTQARTLTLMY
jgi:hypothetical protein